MKNIQCATTGIYFSDADSHFEVIAVTNKQMHAFTLPDEEAAGTAAAILRQRYPSFNWQAVQA